MYVYRIENREGLGPYQGGVVTWRHYDEDHPGPQQDNIPYDVVFSQQYHYGFKSKAQLLNWFSKSDLKRFESSGFYVMRYSVPDTHFNVYKGGNQVAFLKHKASEVKRIKRDGFSCVPVLTPSSISMGYSGSFGQSPIDNYINRLAKEFAFLSNLVIKYKDKN